MQLNLILVLAETKCEYIPTSISFLEYDNAEIKLPNYVTKMMKSYLAGNIEV